MESISCPNCEVDITEYLYNNVSLFLLGHSCPECGANIKMTIKAEYIGDKEIL